VEPLSLDEAYLDVTENLSGLPSATAVARAIREQIREETSLTASAGVAPNKFLAKIASDWRKPDGLFVIKPHEVEAFLPPLAVGIVPGVGKVMVSKLLELGISSVGELRAFGRAALEQRFGHWGARLHELSLGIDERAVTPDRPTQSISAEDTFAEDLLLADLAPHIAALAEKSWRAAQKENERIGRTVVLKLKTRDFQILTRSLTPSAPPATLDEYVAHALALRERVELPTRTRYRLVGVGLSNFTPREELQAQGALFTSIAPG
jgi:DNA polymerase-4